MLRSYSAVLKAAWGIAAGKCNEKCEQRDTNRKFSLMLMACMIAGASGLNTTISSAGVISSISYGHVISIEGQFFNDFSQSLLGTTLPVSGAQGSLSHAGDSLTATYNFTDNGNVAILNIGTSYSESPSTLLETAEDGGSSLTFSHPVNLSFSGSITSVGIFNSVSFETVFQGGSFIINDPQTLNSGTNASYTAPNVNVQIPAGTYSFSEQTGLSAGGTGSGNGSVQLTFTALPIISLSTSAPTAFGNSLGTLTIAGNHGNYVAASKSFSSTYNGYVQTSSWNPTNDIEIYALDISDSIAGNLNADLAALATQVNEGSYSGFSVDASTTDPTTGFLTNIPPDGFNFFVTITNPTLAASSDYFGFDLSQFNANSDALTASAIAVVPEPASLTVLAIASIGLFARRRRHQ